MSTELEIGDALQYPNTREFSHILLNMLDTDNPELLALVRGAMGRSNVAEIRAALDGLSITDRLSLIGVSPSHGSLDNRREVTRFTPFLATSADDENIGIIQAHLSVKFLSDAIRAALMIYALLIRAGAFDPVEPEG